MGAAWPTGSGRNSCAKKRDAERSFGPARCGARRRICGKLLLFFPHHGGNRGGLCFQISSLRLCRCRRCSRLLFLLMMMVVVVVVTSRSSRASRIEGPVVRARRSRHSRGVSRESRRWRWRLRLGSSASKTRGADTHVHAHEREGGGGDNAGSRAHDEESCTLLLQKKNQCVGGHRENGT